MSTAIMRGKDKRGREFFTIRAKDEESEYELNIDGTTYLGSRIPIRQTIFQREINQAHWIITHGAKVMPFLVQIIPANGMLIDSCGKIWNPDAYQQLASLIKDKRLGSFYLT